MPAFTIPEPTKEYSGLLKWLGGPESAVMGGPAPVGIQAGTLAARQTLRDALRAAAQRLYRLGIIEEPNIFGRYGFSGRGGVPTPPMESIYRSGLFPRGGLALESRWNRAQQMPSHQTETQNAIRRFLGLPVEGDAAINPYTSSLLSEFHGNPQGLRRALVEGAKQPTAGLSDIGFLQKALAGSAEYGPATAGLAETDWAELLPRIRELLKNVVK